jgi:hypothetical protein
VKEKNKQHSNQQGKQAKKKKIIAISKHLSVITLNGNARNTLIKRQTG